MKQSELFIGAYVSYFDKPHIVQSIDQRYVVSVTLDGQSMALMLWESVRPLPYSPEWAQKVMPEGWHKVAEIEQAKNKPLYWWLGLEFENASFKFQSVHELQGLVTFLRIEEEVKSLRDLCGDEHFSDE